MIIDTTITNKLVIKTFNSIEDRCSKTHNNKYDYSKSIFKGIKHKIEIICPTHGSFYQSVGNHISRKSGCQKCAKIEGGKKGRKSISSIKQDINNTHKNLYTYDFSSYENTFPYLTIYCKQHGKFKQTLNSHLSGQGCPKCSKNLTWNKESFIEKAKILYENYEYDNINYTTRTNDITIVCKIHGKFTTTPRNHIEYGVECKECKLQKQLSKNYISLLEKAKNKHNNFYNYDKVIYSGVKNKVIITCPIHGDFKQKFGDHLQGNGCQICGEVTMRKKYINKPTLLYYIYLPKYDLYKIGITLVKNGLKKRFPKLEYVIIETIHYITGKYAYEQEQTILKKFSYLKENNLKPLLKGGNSELFVSDILINLKEEYDRTIHTKTNYQLLREVT